jgi:LPS sulfotransferase NodH
MNLHLPLARTGPGENYPDCVSHARGGSDRAQPALSVPHVAVACTLRSGSNLLCEMLRVNGFGTPKEWFQIDTSRLTTFVTGPVSANADLLKLQTEQFLHQHESAPWRGVKWDWRQFQRLRKLAPTSPESASVLRGFQNGKWFLLLRRDLAAQAVSLYAARRTNVWMGEGTTDYRRLAKDFDGIYERFAELSADLFAWETHLSAETIPAMRLYYEDLVSGVPEMWLRVMRHLDPAFEPARLNLEPLQGRPREHTRIRDVKRWFRNQITAGRQPRSAQWLLEEIGRTVARVEGQIPLDGLLGQLTAGLMGSPNAFRVQKLDLRTELHRTGSATLVHGSQYIDRVSLRMDPPAACLFQVTGATRILLQLHAHSWSGIAEIAFGTRTEEIDLFTTHTDSRYVFHEFSEGFTGTIKIRCGGGKNLLSNGAEVWLHRVLVLSAG